MQTQYRFSKLTSDDEPFLDDMLYEAIFVPDGAAPPPREVTQQPTLRKYIRDFGSQAGDLGLKAIDIDTGQPVGAAWLRLLRGGQCSYGYVDDDTPELTMAVAPAYRGQGIGSRLLADLLEVAQETYAAISLSVWPDNPAYRLYQRFGFEFVHAEPDGPAVTLLKRF